MFVFALILLLNAILVLQFLRAWRLPTFAHHNCVVTRLEK